MPGAKGPPITSFPEWGLTLASSSALTEESWYSSSWQLFQVCSGPQPLVPQSFLSPCSNAQPWLLRSLWNPGKPCPQGTAKVVLSVLPHFSIPYPYPGYLHSLVMLCHFLSNLSPFLQVSKLHCSLFSLWLHHFFWPWPCLGLLVTYRWSPYPLTPHYSLLPVGNSTGKTRGQKGPYCLDLWTSRDRQPPTSFTSPTGHPRMGYFWNVGLKSCRALSIISGRGGVTPFSA